MTHDALAVFSELVQRFAPDLLRKARPAPAASLAALERAAKVPLPDDYRRFLETMGGNTRGELRPLWPDDELNVDFATQSYSDPARPTPAGWLFLLQRFEYDLPSYCWHLAPVTAELPAHPLGAFRVAHGRIDGTTLLGSVAHYACLEHWLCEWAFGLIHPDQEESYLRFHRSEPGECDATEYFRQVVEDAGFTRYAGGGDGDWHTLYSRDDDTWLWLEGKPTTLELFGLYSLRIRAPTQELRSAVADLIHEELGPE